MGKMRQTQERPYEINRKLSCFFTVKYLFLINLFLYLDVFVENRVTKVSQAAQNEAEKVDKESMTFVESLSNARLKREVLRLRKDLNYYIG